MTTATSGSASAWSRRRRRAPADPAAVAATKPSIMSSAKSAGSLNSRVIAIPPVRSGSLIRRGRLVAGSLALRPPGARPPAPELRGLVAGDGGLLVRALVLAVGRDLLGRRRARVEPVVQPLAGQPLRHLEPDHALAHAQHRSLLSTARSTEKLSGPSPPDPRHLVRADRDAQAVCTPAARGRPSLHDQAPGRHGNVGSGVLVDVAPTSMTSATGRCSQLVGQERPCAASARSRPRSSLSAMRASPSGRFACRSGTRARAGQTVEPNFSEHGPARGAPARRRPPAARPSRRRRPGASRPPPPPRRRGDPGPRRPPRARCRCRARPRRSRRCPGARRRRSRGTSARCAACAGSAAGSS